MLHCLIAMESSAITRDRGLVIRLYAGSTEKTPAVSRRWHRPRCRKRGATRLLLRARGACNVSISSISTGCAMLCCSDQTCHVCSHVSARYYCSSECTVGMHGTYAEWWSSRRPPRGRFLGDRGRSLASSLPIVCGAYAIDRCSIATDRSLNSDLLTVGKFFRLSGTSLRHHFLQPVHTHLAILPT